MTHHRYKMLFSFGGTWYGARQLLIFDEHRYDFSPCSDCPPLHELKETTKSMQGHCHCQSWRCCCC